jgi:hypothetical protein
LVKYVVDVPVSTLPFKVLTPANVINEGIQLCRIA